MSMAGDSCNTSSLLESQHHPEAEKERGNELDVEMGSNLGNLWDFSSPGPCLVPSFDLFSNYSILKMNAHFHTDEFRDLLIALSLRTMI